MNMIKVNARLAQEADVLSKETSLSFRDCLDIVMKAYLRELQARVEDGALQPT